jgi:hypothetical protein
MTDQILQEILDSIVSEITWEREHASSQGTTPAPAPGPTVEGQQKPAA